jgi:hypothetical protein
VNKQRLQLALPEAADSPQAPTAVSQRRGRG